MKTFSDNLPNVDKEIYDKILTESIAARKFAEVIMKQHKKSHDLSYGIILLTIVNSAICLATLGHIYGVL